MYSYMWSLKFFAQLLIYNENFKVIISLIHHLDIFCLPLFHVGRGGEMMKLLDSRIS